MIPPVAVFMAGRLAAAADAGKVTGIGVLPPFRLPTAKRPAGFHNPDWLAFSSRRATRFFPSVLTRTRSALRKACGWGVVRDEASLRDFLFQQILPAQERQELPWLGQDGVQRTLRTACAETARVIAASRTVARGDAGTFNPLLEIAAMRHERAEERLFIS